MMSKRSVTTTTSVVSVVARLAHPLGDLGAEFVGFASTNRVGDRLGGVDDLDGPSGQRRSENVLTAVGGHPERPLDRRDLSPPGSEHRIVGQRQAVLAEITPQRNEHGADGDDPDHRSAQLLGARPSVGGHRTPR